MEIRLRNSFRFPNDRSAVTRCVCVCGKKTERERERRKIIVSRARGTRLSALFPTLCMHCERRARNSKVEKYCIFIG